VAVGPAPPGPFARTCCWSCSRDARARECRHTRHTCHSRVQTGSYLHTAVSRGRPRGNPVRFVFNSRFDALATPDSLVLRGGVDLENALRELGGAARTAAFRHLGIPRTAIYRAVDAGLLVRRMGVLADPRASHEVVVRAAFGAEFTCVTALAHLGLPLLVRPARTHLLVPRNRGCHETATRPQRAVVLHRSDTVARDPRQRLLLALGVASSCLDARSHLVVLDAALHRGMLRPDALDELPGVPPRRRAWLERHCDPLSGSVTETIAGLEMSRAGIPFRRQVLIDRAGHVDFRVGQSLIVETDGWTYHSDRDSFAEDRRRDREASIQGLTTLRFTYNDIMKRPAACVADIRATLTQLRDPLAARWRS